MLHTAINTKLLRNHQYAEHMQLFESWRPKNLRNHIGSGWEFADLAHFFELAGSRQIHGGSLIVPNALQPWQRNLDADTAWAAAADWIEKAVGLHPQINRWDVLSEIWPNAQTMRQVPWASPGETWWMDEAFRIAHAANPKALLYINEFRPQQQQRWANLLEYAEGALGRGTPIHGVGVQLHSNYFSPAQGVVRGLFRNLLSPQILRPLFRRIKDLGLAINCPETIVWNTYLWGPQRKLGAADQRTFEQYQHQLYKEWLELADAFKIESLGFWCPWDGDTWHWARHDLPCMAGLWRKDWSGRPALKLVFGEQQLSQRSSGFRSKFT